MGRGVIGEDSLLATLKNLSNGSGFCFGLIIGQSTAVKDYIVHFAPSLPPPESEKANAEGDDDCYINELGDYEDSWIGSHTRNVIKMLPGGMSILGVFVVCPNSLSDSAVFNKLRSLAIHSYNSTKNNNFLHLIKNSNRLLLQYSISNKTYVCKSIDAASLNSSLQSVDIKFTTEPFKWYKVDSSVNLTNFGPYFVSYRKENYTIKKMLKEMLSVIQSKIDSCECSIDGKFVELSDDLKTFKDKEERAIKEVEKSTGKQIDFDSKSLAVQLYDRKLPDEFSFKVDHVEQKIEIVFEGDVSSRIFAIGFSSLEDAVKAVKEDLIRCCSTKFEMHWETNDAPLFNSQNGGRRSEEVHMLPRRVLFTLPESNVQFSEYLFLDESAEDIVPSIQEHLGVQVDETSVLDVLEAKCDTSVPSQPELSSKKSISKSGDHRSNNLFIISVGILSLLVLFISLYIQFS